MIDNLSENGKPVLILSGGEPLFRKDIFEIAAYAKSKGLPVALSTNGTLVTKDMARKIKESGVYYASISLDGACAETHDTFRGAGNFEKSLRGLANLREQGIKVQINFTVTKKNVNETARIYDLARESGACALYLFLLVPVGCGVEIVDSQMLSSEEVEEWLKWVNVKERENPFEIRAICAPHFYRVKSQETNTPPSDKRLGCLAGINICFVSHKGEVYPCGYLPASAGNVRSTPLSDIWNESKLFKSFRQYSLLEGKCGFCEYKTVCGGCRARAYYEHQDVLAEEPYCDYKPAAQTLVC